MSECEISHETSNGEFQIKNILSSPRAKRAGPKGLRPESARALVADGAPTVGGGKTF